jgi:beta-glucosidase
MIVKQFYIGISHKRISLQITLIYPINFLKMKVPIALLKKQRFMFLFLKSCTIILILNAVATGYGQTLVEVSIEKKVDNLLDQMTLEEKVGQLTQYSGNGSITGPLKAEVSQLEDIKNGLVGSMLNVIGTQNIRELQKLAVENSRLKIPLIFGLDVVHGYKTIFPIPLAMACSWDLAAIEQSARIAAIEASSAGINWTFAPMVDVSRDPRWGRVMEGAGEDPYYGSLVATAYVHGFQGANLAEKNSIVACAKHFAGYGAVEAGREYNIVDISRRVMNEIYLPPFKAAVEAGVGTLMNAFNEFEETPATANSYLLRDKLKGEWKFSGFVVSNYNSIGELIAHGVAKDKKEAAQLAITAGNDMDMASQSYRKHLVELVRTGSVDSKLVEDAVRRILRIKYQLGLFDNPYKNCDSVAEKKILLSPANVEAARDIARKSMVLLKNEGQILPLSMNIKKVAVIGPLADSKYDMLGSWGAQGDGKDAISVLDGIKAAVSPFTEVLYARGCNIDDKIEMAFDDAIAIAREADVVVMAIGEKWDMSGEASSRADIGIPGKQEELLDKLLKTGKPVVVLLMNGRPLAIPDLVAKAPALIETWFLGTQTGNAIADVLFGKYNPSGKLTMSFPYAVGQIPVYYNHKNTGRPKIPNTENHWVTHYMDIPNEPLFPFGFGLSYTTFEYSDIKLNKTRMNIDDSVTISITVRNTGKYDGEEVVQLYVRDLVGSVTRPVKELKGFRKVMIKTGESMNISFTLKAQDLAFFTKDMTFKAEPGDFKVFVGTSSVDCKEVLFTLY